MWCKAVDYDYGSTDEEWLYEVKAPAPDNLPALRMMEVEGQGYTSILVYPVPDDTPWNLVMGRKRLEKRLGRHTTRG